MSHKNREKMVNEAKRYGLNEIIEHLGYRQSEVVFTIRFFKLETPKSQPIYLTSDRIRYRFRGEKLLTE